MGLVARAALPAVVLVVAGVFWARSRRAELPPQAPATVDSAPAASAPETASVAAPSAPQAAAPEAASAASATPKTPVPGTPAADAGRAGATPPAAAATARNASASPGRAATVDEPPVEVREVKLLTVTGKKTKDDDVFVSFANGQLSVLHKEQGAPLIAWPYRNVLRATYIKARDPRWDTSFASPPDGLDVGGVLRTSKNWFVLQNHDSYMVLRLSDANYARVIELVESRAGIRGARPQQDSDKN